MSDVQAPAASSPHASTDPVRLVEHLFRHEAGRMVAVITGMFGVEHLGLAEDVVQEALARALRTWPYRGVPDNPAAWLMRVARNLALDTVRRQRTFREKEAEIIRLMDRHRDAPPPSESTEPELSDDTLRMLFVCCHPILSPEDQIALALKTLCGFGPDEIAAALLTTDVAVAKRLTRARSKIRVARIPFSVPEGVELARRLDGVLRTLYLLFNEGYKASSGDRLVREELCHEAIRLTTALAAHPVGDQSSVHALLALMWLTVARLAERIDAHGSLLRLSQQDRSRWDASALACGFFHLNRSTADSTVTVYHLQAGITACHASAPDAASTDWKRVLELYDELIRLDSSPVVAMNRAVALAEVRGPQAGLDALAGIPNGRGLESSHLLPAVRGEFHWRLGQREAARVCFEQALGRAKLPSERRLLEGRLADCRSSGKKEAGKKA
jgi:RNA polymerase sigma factor (sigma-70 family)